MTWLLFIFYSTDRKELIKSFTLSSIKEVEYITGVKSQTISNFYHNLIKPRGILKYCILYQDKNN